MGDPAVGSGIDDEQDQIARFLFKLYGVSMASFVIEHIDFDQTMYQLPFDSFSLVGQRNI
jgi:hypothetical protein